MAEPTQKIAKSARGTFSKTKGASSSEEEEFGFVLYRSSLLRFELRCTDEIIYSDHDLLRECCGEGAMIGVTVGGNCLLNDDTVDKMVALMSTEEGGRDEEDRTSVDPARQLAYKEAVLLDFMVEFGENLGDEVTWSSGEKPVTSVSFYLEGETNRSPKSTSLSPGFVVFYDTHAFHCGHELLRGYKGVMVDHAPYEGGFLTYNTVKRMAAELERVNAENDPRHRADGQSSQAAIRQYRGHCTYPAAVLLDFMAVFGAQLKGGEKVTACACIGPLV